MCAGLQGGRWDGGLFPPTRLELGSAGVQPKYSGKLFWGLGLGGLGTSPAQPGLCPSSHSWPQATLPQLLPLMLAALWPPQGCDVTPGPRAVSPAAAGPGAATGEGQHCPSRFRRTWAGVPGIAYTLQIRLAPVLGFHAGAGSPDRCPASDRAAGSWACFCTCRMGTFVL